MADLNVTISKPIMARLRPYAYGAGAGLVAGFVVGTGVRLAVKGIMIATVVGLGYYVSNHLGDRNGSDTNF